MPSWREHLLGRPEEQGPRGLDRCLRRGDPALRIRAARRLVERDEELARARLRTLRRDPLPGLRRAAARSGPASLEELARERCSTVAAELAGACLRAGLEREEVLAGLRARTLFQLETARGPRSPEALMGLGLGRPEEDLALREGPERSELLERLEADPEQPELLERLALKGHTEDHALLLEARKSLGKRGENHWLLALGQHGDPRSLPLLQDLLAEMGVDPGRGFARRRLSALAIGRIGCPSAAPSLVQALEVEALDHEGRPGAGLGVQYPVRAVLLWALGELQVSEHAELLGSYLANAHGSALGGLHLPAMGALWKLGEPARGVLEALAGGAEAEASANARGVLKALEAQ